MKWYKAEHYTYVYPLGPKDRDYYLCMQCNTYDSDNIYFKLGWWLCFPDDLVSNVDFEIDTHEWIAIIFTDDIEME